jgi:hypothetical protein
MTKGQEIMDEWYLTMKKYGSLAEFLDLKIEELRDEYQELVMKAYSAGYEYCEHLDKVFGGSK